MSTEPDYNFNDPVPVSESNSSISALLPLALLSAAFAVVMIAQTTTAFKAKTALRDGKAQLIDLYRQREPQVKQSAAVQKQLQDLILDLLLLAKTDPEAKAIVDKFGIQQQVPAAGGDAAAPAAAPAP